MESRRRTSWKPVELLGRRRGSIALAVRAAASTGGERRGGRRGGWRGDDGGFGGGGGMGRWIRWRWHDGAERGGGKRREAWEAGSVAAADSVAGRRGGGGAWVGRLEVSHAQEATA